MISIVLWKLRRHRFRIYSRKHSYLTRKSARPILRSVENHAHNGYSALGIRQAEATYYAVRVLVKHRIEL